MTVATRIQRGLRPPAVLKDPAPRAHPHNQKRVDAIHSRRRRDGTSGRRGVTNPLRPVCHVHGPASGGGGRGGVRKPKVLKLHRDAVKVPVPVKPTVKHSHPDIKSAIPMLNKIVSNKGVDPQNPNTKIAADKNQVSVFTSPYDGPLPLPKARYLNPSSNTYRGSDPVKLTFQNETMQRAVKGKGSSRCRAIVGEERLELRAGPHDFLPG